MDRAQRAAVDEDRGADPARERAEVRRQRPGHLGLPAGRVAQCDPRDARADERGAQGERAAQRPAARQPRDRPADEREGQVEAHLDVHRPHRRVEHVARRRDEVGDEEQEERHLAQADVARVPGAVQEHERADEGDEVAGDDPGRAADREAPEMRGRPVAARRGHPRGGEQERGQHEEQLDARAELADHAIDQHVVVRVVSLRVHPHVQDQDGQGGKPAQAVQAVCSRRVHPPGRAQNADAPISV